MKIKSIFSITIAVFAFVIAFNSNSFAQAKYYPGYVILLNGDTLKGEVKKNPRMHIPIIGNGDITTPQRAKECFDQYGVDAIMIGRASFGRPWIFKEVKHYIETGKELPALSFEWLLNVLRQEVLDSVNLLDERRGILHVRRHLAASPLFKGIPNFKETRIAMLRAETVKELFSILDYIRGNYGMNS